MEKKSFFTVQNHTLTNDPNFLYEVYNNPDEAVDLLSGFSEHSLNSKLRTAQLLMDAGQHDKVLEIIGRNLILKELMPDRKMFHVQEFVAFEHVAIRYLLDTGDEPKAGIRLNFIAGKFPKDTGTLVAIDYYNDWLVKKSRQYRKEWLADTDMVDRDILPPFWRDQKVGDLQLIATDRLYNGDFSIAPHVISEILDSPRDLLISDLENLIREAVIYQDQVSDNSDFVLHGIFFLGEIRAYESLPLVLETLKLDKEFLDFWFGDMLYEIIWEPLYKLSEKRLDLLEDFMKQPDVHEYSKGVVADVVEQIAYHQPERRNEVIEWFRRQLEFYSDQEIITDPQDNGTLTYLICSVVDLRAVELWPLCRELFNQQKVELSMTGPLEELEPDMFQEFDPHSIKTLLPIEERYPILVEQWYEASFETEEENEHNHDADVKIPGRNDPCSCGSGKKYKKCCGKC